MGCLALEWFAIEETAPTIAWVKSRTGSSVAYPYLPLIFLRICRISWAYFATPISLKWRPSFLKSVLDRSWVSMCQFFRCLTCWTIKSFTSSILLLNAGLSCRGGILDIITILSLLLRDTLSMICRNSSLHFTRGWESMLFVPAASTVTSLDGICLIWAFICRAVLPGYTYPEASQSLPCTRGATPRTIELPTIVTVIGFRVGLFARRGCWCWLVVAGLGPVGPSSRAAGAAYRFCVVTPGPGTSRPVAVDCGEEGCIGRGSCGVCAHDCSLIVSISFFNSELCWFTDASFCLRFPFSVLRSLISFTKSWLLSRVPFTNVSRLANCDCIAVIADGIFRQFLHVHAPIYRLSSPEHEMWTQSIHIEHRIILASALPWSTQSE